MMEPVPAACDLRLMPVERFGKPENEPFPRVGDDLRLRHLFLKFHHGTETPVRTECGPEIRLPAQGPFEIVQEGTTAGLDAEAAADRVRGYADAGATWWLEEVWRHMYRHPGDPAPLRDDVLRGPPLRPS